MSNLIKIGIDPSGTGTTAIVVYKDNKIIEKQEFFNKKWMEHYEYINDYVCKYYYQSNKDGFFPYEEDGSKMIWNIEDCLYTNANASKDRDDLLRLLGVCKVNHDFNWISPKHTKSVVKNMENFSKYNNNCIQEFSKDENLTYKYGKSWKYNNEKNK